MHWSVAIGVYGKKHSLEELRLEYRCMNDHCMVAVMFSYPRVVPGGMQRVTT